MDRGGDPDELFANGLNHDLGGVHIGRHLSFSFKFLIVF